MRPLIALDRKPCRYMFSLKKCFLNLWCEHYNSGVQMNLCTVKSIDKLKMFKYKKCYGFKSVHEFCGAQ